MKGTVRIRRWQRTPERRDADWLRRPFLTASVLRPDVVQRLTLTSDGVTYVRRVPDPKVSPSR